MKLSRTALFIGTVLVSVAVSANQTDAQANTWVDSSHQTVRTTLHDWVNTLDNWIGVPDPNKPATATLRVMMDSQWNHYDHLSFKPRVRLKVRLPGLKNRFSLVVGDESLDNELQGGAESSAARPIANKRRWDNQQNRDDNSSLALRWSAFKKSIDAEIDLDLGIRKWNDPYVRLKLAKDWQLTDSYSTRLEAIYRYGLDTRNYLRGNAEVRYTQDERHFIANQVNVQYVHNDNEESTFWGNSLFRQHDYANFKRLNYGIYTGGNFKNKNMHLNSYGPYVQWRQPIWRQWLFIQPELTYYNNKDKDRDHAVGVFVRLEAIF
ncbi:hypothetical protein EDC44_12314 [Cricetibacter osteomyelitidis]|uniref:Outer membrane protein n=1 Tax=Cricetibacter osteomyelitidis TaxID=1521931 RepID=A0A4R2SXM4_9PAST|nr:hypothetical protein [Cricetibacter osteomyelitidis]TCP93214.1 hypothetical protein EDC44_12314 [Cricetibacter osteomyelitidis]